MGKNRVFFPQEALDRWLVEGRVEISGSELTIPDERRRFRLVEAVHRFHQSEATPLVGNGQLRAGNFDPPLDQPAVERLLREEDAVFAHDDAYFSRFAGGARTTRRAANFPRLK